MGLSKLLLEVLGGSRVREFSDDVAGEKRKHLLKLKINLLSSLVAEEVSSVFTASLQGFP